MYTLYRYLSFKKKIISNNNNYLPHMISITGFIRLYYVIVYFNILIEI